MRANAIVIVEPCFNQDARFVLRGEPLLIEAFVTKPAIEAFDIRGLGGLARLGKGKLYAFAWTPGIKRRTSEFRRVSSSWSVRTPVELPPGPHCAKTTMEKVARTV